MNFKTEISVQGKSLQGQIKDGKFNLVLLPMVSLGREEGISPPMRSMIVDKEWIDTVIEELKAVREKL